MRDALFLALLSITLSLSVSGKNNRTSFARDTIPDYFSHRFTDHWDIGIAGGLNLYFGEEDAEGDWGKRISPSFEISVKKKIAPAVSLRGLASIGVVNDRYRSSTPMNAYDGNLHFEKFNLATAQLHILFDVRHAIGGYSKKRKLNIAPFLGTGAAHSWGGNRNNRELIFPVGVLNQVHLSSKLDLTVELRHILVNSRMNGVVESGRSYEGMGTFSAGLSYIFGKQNFKKTAGKKLSQSAKGMTNRDLFLLHGQRALYGDTLAPLENTNDTVNILSPDDRYKDGQQDSTETAKWVELTEEPPRCEFCVVVASLSTYNGAKSVADSYRRTGYDSAVISDTGNRYRVTLGCYRTYDVALQELRKTREFVRDAWLLEVCR